MSTLSILNGFLVYVRTYQGVDELLSVPRIFNPSFRPTYTRVDVYLYDWCPVSSCTPLPSLGTPTSWTFSKQSFPLQLDEVLHRSVDLLPFLFPHLRCVGHPRLGSRNGQPSRNSHLSPVQFPSRPCDSRHRRGGSRGAVSGHGPVLYLRSSRTGRSSSG